MTTTMKSCMYDISLYDFLAISRAAEKITCMISRNLSGSLQLTRPSRTTDPTAAPHAHKHTHKTHSRARTKPRLAVQRVTVVPQYVQGLGPIHGPMHARTQKSGHAPQ